jgi:hypothetical protein
MSKNVFTPLVNPYKRLNGQLFKNRFSKTNLKMNMYKTTIPFLLYLKKLIATLTAVSPFFQYQQNQGGA